jgi:hypothetical protein
VRAFSGYITTSDQLAELIVAKEAKSGRAKRAEDTRCLRSEKKEENEGSRLFVSWTP